ncbi:hypothetical protein RSAG8_05930, partial [Rhizoctonia solani AG-8 WAC10335]
MHPVCVCRLTDPVTCTTVSALSIQPPTPQITTCLIGVPSIAMDSCGCLMFSTALSSTSLGYSGWRGLLSSTPSTMPLFETTTSIDTK